MATLTMDHACEVLGVTLRDAWDDVKAAYRRKARQLHPDLQQGSNTTAQFQEVQAAYQLLEANHARFAAYAFDQDDSFASTYVALDVPDPEWVNVEGILVLIHYDRLWRGGPLQAILEINLEDVLRLPWYPQPEHAERISSVRVIQDGKAVMNYSRWIMLDDIAQLRKEFLHWQTAKTNAEKAEIFGQRLNDLKRQRWQLEHSDRPLLRFDELLRQANTALARFSSSYRTIPATTVEQRLVLLEAEIDRLNGDGAQVLIDDLIEGVLDHPDHRANLAVIDQVRELSIRTGGFIEPISEPTLRAFYQQHISCQSLTELHQAQFRLNLEDYAPSDWIAELAQQDGAMAPETLLVESRKGQVSQPVRYDVLQRDGEAVVVGVVSMALTTYERNAREYGKPSKFPELLHGIKLYFDVTVSNEVIASGFEDDLEKKIAKYKRSQNRSKALAGVSDSVAFITGVAGRLTPLSATPLPPWYKGARPRW